MHETLKKLTSHVRETRGAGEAPSITCSECYVQPLDEVIHSDFLNNNLPDKCANLIIADPPYFEVKGAFDFVWNSFEDYLKDVEKWAIECKRILADNGTLFWWGDKKKIAYSQIILDKYFNLENSIVWRKIDSMQYQYYSPDLARTFNTHNERLLMYSNSDNLIGEIIKNARIKAGLSAKQLTEYGKFYKNTNHGGAVSNWEIGNNIPSEEQWFKMKEIIELPEDYRNLVRYFYNPLKLEEILQFSQEGNISRNYDHETIKPEKLTRALILTCSRKNDLVVVPFAGSGTEVAMSIKEGRKSIGFDIEKKYVDMSNARIKTFKDASTLF